MSETNEYAALQARGADASDALRAETAEIAAEALMLSEGPRTDGAWQLIVALIAAGQDIAALAAAMAVIARRSEDSGSEAPCS